MARGERDGLVTRRSEDDGSRAVVVELTAVLTRESELLDSLAETERSVLADQLQRLLSDVAVRVRAGSSSGSGA